MTTMVLNAMDSPLEALAFDYLNSGLLPLLNNVWTWIAVIAAAISFWRFKAVVLSSADLLPPTAPSPPAPAPLQDEKTLEGSETHACKPTPAPSPVSTPGETFDAGEVVDNLAAGTTKKKKFTLYYKEVEKAEKEEDEEEEGVEEWWKRWEEALGTRRGEKGWYRYQHLGRLNGNVVRLWDGNGQCAMGNAQWAS